MTLRERDPRVPVVVVVERDKLERYPWHEVADDCVYPGVPTPELRVRLAMVRRRTGTGDGMVTGWVRSRSNRRRIASPRADVAVDLTYKEFELLRFLASRSRACSPAPPSYGKSGATTSTAARGPSTCTCVGCARSSARSTST